MWNTLNLVGNTYGRLIVTKRAENDRFGRSMWECACTCGKYTVVASNKLKNGNTKSCGCLITDTNRQRLPQDTIPITEPNQPRLKTIHKHMKKRCYSPKDKDYKYYGDRGITLCDEWLNFPTFYRWALENGYESHLTIDRIDNDLGYSPDNCRWVTVAQQNRNKRKRL